MLPIQLLSPAAKIPARSYKSDAGYDCYCTTETILLPGKTTKIPLGFALEMPEDTSVYGQLASRSGLASKGIFVMGGVIDPGYRDEISCLLFNAGEEAHYFSHGDRVCQLIFFSYFSADFQEVPMLAPSSRGKGGFGSTGGLGKSILLP